MKLIFSTDSWKNLKHLHQHLPSGSRIVPFAGQMDGQIDMMKLLVAFRSLANAPENRKEIYIKYSFTKNVIYRWLILLFVFFRFFSVLLKVAITSAYSERQKVEGGGCCGSVEWTVCLFLCFLYYCTSVPLSSFLPSFLPLLLCSLSLRQWANPNTIAFPYSNVSSTDFETKSTLKKKCEVPRLEMYTSVYSNLDE